MATDDQTQLHSEMTALQHTKVAIDEQKYDHWRETNNVIVQHSCGKNLSVRWDKSGLCTLRRNNGSFARWNVKYLNNTVKMYSKKTKKYLRIFDNGTKADALGNAEETDILFEYDEQNNLLRSKQFPNSYLATKQDSEDIIAVQDEQYVGSCKFEIDYRYKDTDSSEYWLHSNGFLSGPFDVLQLKKLYTSNVLRKQTMKIQLATKIATERWYEMDLSDEKLGDNEQIKQDLSYLYEEFVDKIINKEICKHQVPDPPPRSNSTCQKFAQLFTHFVRFIYKVHSIAGILFGIIVWLIGACMYGGFSNYLKVWVKSLRLRNAVNLCSSVLQFLITPLFIIFIFRQTYEWHSVMIAYLVWGALSFLIVGGSCLSDVIRPEKHKVIRSNVAYYSFFMAGIGTEGIDMYEVQKKHWSRAEGKKTIVLFEAVFILIPSMICIIPAVATGFIVNYCFEEKLLLKCAPEIVDSVVCFEEQYGCCRVISSWNFTLEEFGNQSIFISSIFANIIGAFALVKLMIWIYAKGHPILGAMAVKKK